MTKFTRSHLVGVLAFALCAGTACSELSPSSGTSPTPSASASAPRSPAGTPSKLAPAVQMPDGFPTDFPIYPGSRLTQAGKFSSNGTTNWGMEWQTLDRTTKVQTFFVARLDAGDWTLTTYSGTVDTSFSASFRRKSDAKTTGTLSATTNAGVTKISVVLTTSP
jgi:hypothetical protein